MYVRVYACVYIYIYIYINKNIYIYIYIHKPDPGCVNFVGRGVQWEVKQHRLGPQSYVKQTPNQQSIGIDTTCAEHFLI